MVGGKGLNVCHDGRRCVLGAREEFVVAQLAPLRGLLMRQAACLTVLECVQLCRLLQQWAGTGKRAVQHTAMCEAAMNDCAGSAAAAHLACRCQLELNSSPEHSKTEVLGTQGNVLVVSFFVGGVRL